MFLIILEFTVANKKNCLGKTGWKMWSQILKNISHMFTKLLFKKSAKTKKNSNSNHESVHNLWRILGTKLVPLVDLWNHIKKKILYKLFFCFLFHTQKCLKTCLNSVTKCVTAKLFFSLNNFKDNLGNYSTSVRPHYPNSFFLKTFFLFSTLKSRMSKNMCFWRHKLCNAKTGVGPNFTWSNEAWYRAL